MNAKTTDKLKPLPKLDKAIKEIYSDKRIYYTRKGNYAECTCGECGENYTIRTTETGDYFKDAALGVEMPKRDKKTKCRKCGATVFYKPKGHCKNAFNYAYIVVGQKIKDDWFVFRVIDICQYHYTGYRTKYDFYEYKRIFCEKGKKPTRQISHGSYNGKQYWHMSTAGDNYCYTVFPTTTGEIRRTGMFKYIPVSRKITDRYRLDCWLMKYYMTASRYPDFEMMIKLGMEDMAYDLICGYKLNLNPRGKTIENRLRINKEHLQKLIEAHGNRWTLKVLQLERKLGKHWTDEELDFVKELNTCYYTQFPEILNYTTPTKLKNYFKKQKMDFYTDRRTCGRTDPYTFRREYFDYIHMRIAEGYDMTNEIYLFPKDLRRRHDEMVLAREKAQLDKRLSEVHTRYKNIAKNYKKLANIYQTSAAGLTIRPAKSAEEIVMEGRLLHHCVGDDNYLRSHNSQISFILLLRKEKNPEEPYITVEIKDNKIRQWFGAYDKKPDEKKIDRWLNRYIKNLTAKAI